MQLTDKLCVVCSAGGHLTEALLSVEKINYPIFYVTYRLPHTDESLEGKKYYYIINPHKYLYKYPLNFIQSLIIFFKTKPRFILSTGSGMAIATCLIGKLFGSKIIYVETGCRITTPSMTGRLMYHFSDLFIVQWKSLLKVYPKATYGGLLF
jgi:UDP-N-acetylglucosamine:LPS N-acetylglucosamine transferase